MPETEKKWGHNPDTWMVVLTAVLMVVGIGTAWIFYRQFGEMKAQTAVLNQQAKQAAVDSVEATKRVEQQLDISRQQVSAAQANVKAVRQQMRQDQRAWIGAVKAMPFSLKEDTPVRLGVVILNSGKSPALDVRGRLGALPLPKDKKFAAKYVEPFQHSGVLQPNMQITEWSGPLTVNKPLLDALKRGDQILYFYGEATYSDIFKQSHRTTFCLYIQPTLDGVIPCDTYSYAD